MMKHQRPFEKQKPLLHSLVYMMIPISLAVLSGALIATLRVKGNMISVIQGCFFAIALLITLTIAKNESGRLSSLGYRRSEGWTPLTYLAALLMALIISSNFVNGLRPNLTVDYIIIRLVFAAVVGFAEETVFRGLIFRTLRYCGLTFAVLISSLMFGLGHIFQLLSGAHFLLTLLQIILAFVFGLTFVLWVIKLKSLWLPVLFHAAHNFTEYIRMERSIKNEALFGTIQCVLLLIVAYILLRSLTDKDRMAISIDGSVHDSHDQIERLRELSHS